MSIVKEGDYRKNKGWGGVCCWNYGSLTIQGLIPYFYIHFKKNRHFQVIYNLVQSFSTGSRRL